MRGSFIYKLLVCSDNFLTWLNTVSKSIVYVPARIPPLASLQWNRAEAPACLGLRQTLAASCKRSFHNGKMPSFASPVGGREFLLSSQTHYRRETEKRQRNYVLRNKTVVWYRYGALGIKRDSKEFRSRFTTSLYSVFTYICVYILSYTHRHANSIDAVVPLSMAMCVDVQVQ